MVSFKESRPSVNARQDANLASAGGLLGPHFKPYGLAY